MTNTLKQNSVYLKLKDSFKKDYFEESLACYQGFVLGLLAQGFTSSNRDILKHTFEIFNDNQPLPGEGIAIYTTLLIEMERQLNEGKVQFFIPTAQDREPSQSKKDFNVIRLDSLSDLAYGITLAYNFKVDGIIKQSELTPIEKEELEVLSNIVQVDPKSKLDEDDISSVTEYILDTLYRRAKLNKDKSKAQ